MLTKVFAAPRNGVLVAPGLLTTPEPLAEPKPAELKPEGAAADPKPKPEGAADPESTPEPELEESEIGELASELEYTGLEYAGLEPGAAAEALLGVSPLGMSGIPALAASLAAVLKASRVLPVLSSGLSSC